VLHFCGCEVIVHLQQMEMRNLHNTVSSFSNLKTGNAKGCVVGDGVQNGQGEKHSIAKRFLSATCVITKTVNR
jgi:hypothetical protein